MWLFSLLYVILVIGVVAVVVRQKRDPAVAAAWTLTVAVVPVLGLILYILIGYNRRDVVSVPFVSCGNRLSGLITNGCGSELSLHNKVILLHNGNNAFSALIAALQKASRSIHMEYYIIREDRIGNTIADILVRKARSGVEVRVIYDAIGSWNISGKMLCRMRSSGVDVRGFEPVRFPWFTDRVNRRNHRKVVVVDGRVAFLGGINIAKYYLDGDYMGKWRDEHLRIEGDAVADLQKLFSADWLKCGGDRLDIRRYIVRHNITERLLMQIAWAESGRSRTTIADAFTAAITGAKRIVRISSPYFMPPPVLMNAIRIAVRSGVEVRVMLPAASDSRFVGLASESYIEDLLDAGVILYRYDNGFLHAKLLVVDDTMASVGTANMDYRSMEDNAEVTAFIFDRTVVGLLADTFDQDRVSCVVESTEHWSNRTLCRRTLCDFARLLSPLM